jgi:hypothetical protein
MRSIGDGVRWFLRSRLLWAILALFAIFAFLWFVPQLQGADLPQKLPAKERAALVNEYRRTWAQIIGGFALLLGLYFTWRRVEISQRTLEATQDQQVTERFTRAIDQLGKTDDKGNKLLEIRLGGIYALERIARESDEDYWPIMEVLTAYVRQHAPLTPEKEATEEGSDEEVRAPDPDIQAIMTVLRRRTHAYELGEPEPLDLHATELSGANLSNADLSDADLSGADLSGADLLEANLNQVQLEETMGDEFTKLPSGLKPPAHWGVKTDEQIEEED